ncbi:unnamed protein product, partial [marine sediment metagenome]
KMAVKSLRRVWVVIHGANPPEGEIENAIKIASHIRSKINIVRVLPSDALALDLLTKLANVVTVGGPIANEWAFKLNEYVNPKYDMTVLREKTPEETWGDYIRSGAVEVHGFLKNTTKYAGVIGTGIIGVGTQRALRARPLRVIHVGGWGYCDTCAMGEAFRADAGQGVYETGYTADIPTEEPCPVGATYRKIADP